ncbi:hypothetical protein H1W00_04605 [Aeromicrobium sp. Marseille-Q0843]|uniref:Uncharacterized protein n=1 Tax=Aeromicrobium phoceense TaxID=2754045 RepID=A0A838XFQ0_9ACTN|nr:protealysin inhibitor emfourin [Aeromicrobium phoceense]MBA4607751.1 hypothetical protein [Aeromicrobium phoceense]
MDGIDQPLLVVRVTRTGGFAGLRRQWEVEATSEDEAQAWWPLVEACPWDATPGDGYPDGFVYELQANDREATLPERQVDGPWRELVEAVVHHAP